MFYFCWLVWGLVLEDVLGVFGVGEMEIGQVFRDQDGELGNLGESSVSFGQVVVLGFISLGYKEFVLF